jgi:hypothetical protein
MPYFYHAFGLIISSEILLSGLGEIQKKIIFDEKADIHILLGKVPEKLDNSKIETPIYMAHQEATLVKLESVARCLATEGRVLIVEPFSSVDKNSLEVFVLNTGMVALLQQRPGLVLQASAIQWRNGALVFIGLGATGKSTLAIQLAEYGYKLVTDETAMITIDKLGEPIIQPGYPAVKIWPDTLSCLKHTWPQSRDLRPGVKKQLLQIPEYFIQKALPIKGIFRLQPSRKLETKIESIHGSKRLLHLAATSNRFKSALSAVNQESRFEVMGKLSALKKFYQIEWPILEPSSNTLPSSLSQLLNEEFSD